MKYLKLKFDARWATLAMVLVTLPLVGCGARGAGETPDTLERMGARKKAIKIGFITSDNELKWYSVQIDAAKEKCKELNCEVIPVQARTEQEMESALTALAGQEARAVLVAASNPALGDRIVGLAEKYRLRLMCVDSRLTSTGMGGEVKYLDQPFVGPDYREVGNKMGHALLEEMTKRGWNIAEVGVVAVRIDSTLEGTMRARGAQEILDEAGISPSKVFAAQWPFPQSSENAVTTAAGLFRRGAGTQKWVAFGYNDTAALGITRAAEAAGISADNLIVVGATAFGVAEEFKKPASAFFGSVYVSPKKQAARAIEQVHLWSTGGVEPDTLPRFQESMLLTRENYEAKLKEDGLL